MTQTLKEKNVWNEHFTAYMRDLDKKKPVIWMGDMNVAPTAKGRCLYVPCRFTLIQHPSRSRKSEFKLEQNSWLHAG